MSRNNLFPGRMLAIVIVLLVALSLTLLWPTAPPPSAAVRSTTCRIAFAIRDDYERLGLQPPNSERIYFSSVTGSVFRCLRGGAKHKFSAPYNTIWLKNFRFNVFAHPNEFAVEAKSQTVSIKWLVFKKPQSQSYTEVINRLPADQVTRLLLVSVSAGTTEWKQQIYKFGPLVVGAKPDPIPAIYFDRPINETQLGEYKQWLVKMAGSWDRFRDDWDHEIKLAIEKASTPLLVASSAGLDGKWNTKDDMVIKRDAKTGQIVEKIGFGVEKIACGCTCVIKSLKTCGQHGVV
jgi:hypothetical protein